LGDNVAVPSVVQANAATAFVVPGGIIASTESVVLQTIVAERFVVPQGPVATALVVAPGKYVVGPRVVLQVSA